MAATVAAVAVWRHVLLLWPAVTQLPVFLLPLDVGPSQWYSNRYTQARGNGSQGSRKHFQTLYVSSVLFMLIPLHPLFCSRVGGLYFHYQDCWISETYADITISPWFLSFPPVCHPLVNGFILSSVHTHTVVQTCRSCTLCQPCTVPTMYTHASCPNMHPVQKPLIRCSARYLMRCQLRTTHGVLWCTHKAIQILDVYRR